MKNYCALRGGPCEHYRDPVESNERREHVFLIYDSKVSQKYWRQVKKLILAHGLKVFDPMEKKTLGYFLLKKICCGIRNCLFTVADMSHWRKGSQAVRPNVFFEIGLALANDKPCVLLDYVSKKGKSLAASDFDGIETCRFLSTPSVLTDKEKEHISERLVLAHRDALENFLKEYCRRRGEELSLSGEKHYFNSPVDLLQFQHKIDLFNLPTVCLFQDPLEKYFQPDLVRRLSKLKAKKTAGVGQAIRSYQKAFRTLINNKQYLEIVSYGALLMFCMRPQWYLGNRLGLADKQGIISSLRSFIEKDNHYDLYVLWDESDPLPEEFATIIKGDSLAISTPNASATSKQGAPATWGNFCCRTIGQELSDHKTARKDKRLITKKAEVLEKLGECEKNLKG